MTGTLLTYDSNGFYLNGKPFRILSGDIHYFRVHPSDWARRLMLMKDFGLNCVQVYVPWSLHEPRKGEFRFDGMLDLGAFLTECEAAGLYVLLRPSPYICSECDFGALPWWLLKEDMVIRSSDERYLKHVREYYKRLLPEFLPHLSTRGGCVIALAVENEYGSYGCDDIYMDALAQMLIDGGVDTPLYTTDGGWKSALRMGSLQKKPSFIGLNYRAKAGEYALPKKNQTAMRPDVPFFAGELWVGRAVYWGEPFFRRDPREAAAAIKELNDAGENMNLYMFSGGTSFGFFPGATHSISYTPREGAVARYIPHVASYEQDAVLDEAGNPTPKYALCRFKRDKEIPAPTPAQSLTVRLTQSARLLDNVPRLTAGVTRSALPVSIEDLDCGFGLMLYTFRLPSLMHGTPSMTLDGVRDRASLYVDGKYAFTVIRDRGVTCTADGVQGAGESASVPADCRECEITVLNESLGRINYGPLMAKEKKGIGALRADGNFLFGCESRALSLDDLTVLGWKENAVDPPRSPVFRRGFFDARAGIDTYVHTEGFSYGWVWMNGFHLGRYDCAGPQYTLYVPGALIKEKGNELIILDLRPEGEKEKIELIDHSILEGEAKELK